MVNFKFLLKLDDAPIWNGEEECNHLLVIAEQGVGDEIFYSSMLGKLQEKVKKITVCLDKRLISIFSRSFPGIIFLDKKSELVADLYDAQIPLGSLPRVLNIDFSKGSHHAKPYLMADTNLSKKLKESSLFKDKFTCGISWKSTNLKIGHQKSISVGDLKEILKLPSCEFINLQYGDIYQDIKDAEDEAGKKINIVEDLDLYNDIDSLMSLISCCDIVITTSNITAHLAGAIGKNTLLLLPYSKGRIWYWHDEEVSSWYPTVRQYFQTRNFSWSEAIKEVALELKKEIDESR